MAMITEYHDPQAIEAKQAQEAFISAVMEKAADLGIKYDIESMRFINDKAYFLVAARRTKGGGMNVTYRTEAAIIKHAREAGLI